MLLLEGARQVLKMLRKKFHQPRLFVLSKNSIHPVYFFEQKFQPPHLSRTRE